MTWKRPDTVGSDTRDDSQPRRGEPQAGTANEESVQDNYFPNP